MTTFITAIIATWLTFGQLFVNVAYEACTKSDQMVATSFVINDQAKEETAHIKGAFKQTANSMTTEQLQSAEGFQAFIAKLTDADKAVLAAVAYPEATGESCKVD